MEKAASVGTPAGALKVVTLSIVVVAVASAVHALALGYVATKIATNVLEEEDRRQTGGCIQRQVEEHFGDSVFATLRDESRREEAAAALLKLMRRHGGFRIKVYDDRGAILWSDERRLIGHTFPDNFLLHRALRGEIVSKIEKPKRSEHVYEREAATYVTETYVPIYFSSARPLGVVEVYRNSDETVRQVARVKRVVWTGAGVATLILCAGVGLVLGWTQRRTLRLHEELHARSNDLAREKSKLDAIVQGVGAGLGLIDREHRIVWANQALGRLFDVLSDPIGKHCYEVCWERETLCEGCPSEKAWNTGQECRTERVRQGPSGPPRHLQITAWPVRDASGTVTHTLELVEDVTDNVRLQAELRQSAKLAAVGELAGGVAHEINNPTGVILATSTHLVSRAPSDLREPLTLIASNAERITRITKALLDFSRRAEGIRKPVSLNQVVEGCVPLLRQRLGRRTILSVELAPSLPQVVANDNEIQQVLINLVNNACDAMADGGSLRIVTRLAGTERVAVAVIDTGPGIAPHHRDRLFEPFFTTKPAGVGTGLGLAVSQRIATAHGGRISVQSEPGCGAAFVLELPAHREEGS